MFVVGLKKEMSVSLIAVTVVNVNLNHSITISKNRTGIMLLN